MFTCGHSDLIYSSAYNLMKLIWSWLFAYQLCDFNSLRENSLLHRVETRFYSYLTEAPTGYN